VGVFVPCQRAPVAGAGADGRPTLVVLPFQDIGEPDDEFFADGISEEITSRLSRIQGMRVIARNSALRFDPSATSAQDFGRRLGADYVLDGTVRWVRGAAGVRVRVTPALVDVRDAQQVWGEGYDAVVEDVLGIQSDISGKVVDALRVELGGDERQRLADAGTSDPEAQSEYLIGRFQWRKRTTDGLLQAVEHFQRAVDLDPNYARGWAGVADAVGLLPYFGIRHIPKAAAYDRAEQAARRALELDSTLAEGWASLCQVLQNGRWDWENAERACRRAVALDPDYATAHQWLGEVLLATGRLDEAVTAVARGAELDPFSPIIQNQLGFFLTGVGRMAEAERVLRRAAELEPELAAVWGNLMDLHALEGRADEAVAEAHKWGTLLGLTPGQTQFIAVLYRGIADPAARTAAIAAIDRAGAGYDSVPLNDRAKQLAMLGLLDRAFAVVDTMLAIRDEGLIFAHGRLAYRPLRGDPRWERVSRQMGVKR